MIVTPLPTRALRRRLLERLEDHRVVGLLAGRHKQHRRGALLFHDRLEYLERLARQSGRGKKNGSGLVSAAQGKEPVHDSRRNVPAAADDERPVDAGRSNAALDFAGVFRPHERRKEEKCDE